MMPQHANVLGHVFGGVMLSMDGYDRRRVGDQDIHDPARR